MTEGQAKVQGRRDWWLGLLIPIPVFVQVQGPLGFYAEAWTAPQGLGVPLGFLAAALLLVPDLPTMARRLPLGWLPRTAIGVLCVWVFGLSVFSALRDPVSLLYALQWIAPVCLVSYVTVVAQEEKRLRAMLLGLRRGTAIALALLGVLGVAELARGGSFEGRITQNLFFPGMYQLYNYVPVGLTLAGLFCAGLCALHPTEQDRRATWLFLCGSAMVPLLTGARDPAILFLVVAPFPAWWSLGVRGLAALCAGCTVLILGLLMAADGNLLLLHKFSAMLGSDADVTLRGMVGNRAGIVEGYWSIVQRHPWAGTALLPPWIADPDAGVVAKGAHNYYLDTLAWAGPVALVSVMALVVSTLRSVPRLLWYAATDRDGLREPASTLTRAARAAAAPAAGLLLISSNLRTPLREPISAMIGYLLIGLILAWAYRARRR